MKSCMLDITIVEVIWVVFKSLFIPFKTLCYNSVNIAINRQYIHKMNKTIFILFGVFGINLVREKHDI